MLSMPLAALHTLSVYPVACSASLCIGGTKGYYNREPLGGTHTSPRLKPCSHHACKTLPCGLCCAAW
jgi:hypothetical protein